MKRNEYHDSWFLHYISAKISQIDGVTQSAIVMASRNNKIRLKRAGLLIGEARKAGPDDLVIVMRTVTKEVAQKALRKLQHFFAEGTARTGVERFCKTQNSALKEMPDANLAIISVPREFAAREAEKALKNSLNVLLFSDGVCVEDEVYLKKMAQKKELLLMGPDCGTAIINGVALGFGNIVDTGPIGIVGASGTGIQELTVLLDRSGLGISQAIGTGSRDLSDDVCGITTLQAIKLLEHDENTRVIILISKPPGIKGVQEVLAKVKQCKKPIIVNFMGREEKRVLKAGAIFASTIEDAAGKAIALVEGRRFRKRSFGLPDAKIKSFVSLESSNFSSEQKYIRGLFCGGSLCNEAMSIMKNLIGDVYSNIALETRMRLEDPDKSYKHSVIDLGASEFTEGRPHPMVDPSIRNQRILKEAEDPEVAVLLFDIILGYGAHPDPVGVVSAALLQAKQLAQEEGRYLSLVASVCGTERDPQNLDLQETKLREAGVVVMPSNSQAARIAALIATRGRVYGKL